MIEFIKILLFSKIITLTPVPVDIDRQLILDLNIPIKAITSGAGIEIDLSKQVRSSIGNKDMFETFDFMEEKFPEGSIHVQLKGKSQFILLDKISYGYSNGSSKVKVSSASGVPEGIEFTSVIINTNVPLQNAIISWKNYKH